MASKLVRAAISIILLIMGIVVFILFLLGRGPLPLT